MIEILQIDDNYSQNRTETESHVQELDAHIHFHRGRICDLKSPPSSNFRGIFSPKKSIYEQKMSFFDRST